jgi:hypothetical protein
MSLPYSEFQTDNSNKKRQPTLGKPKITPTVVDNFQAQIADENAEKQKRMNRLNELLTSTQEEDGVMGNYQPLQHPALNVKPDYETGENPAPMKYSPVFNNPTVTEEPKYGNYRQIYDKPMTFVQQGKKPYYSTMGISSSSSSSSEMDKIMEKLNYMTHLLEEQKNEKTNNIGEEFVLYTFLGVFIIYVVDSFSRSGKYVR